MTDVGRIAEALADIANATEGLERVENGGRCVAIARTKLDEARMWLKEWRHDPGTGPRLEAA